MRYGICSSMMWGHITIICLGLLNFFNTNNDKPTKYINKEKVTPQKKNTFLLLYMTMGIQQITYTYIKVSNKQY